MEKFTSNNKTGFVILFILLQATIASLFTLPGQLSVDSLVQLYEGRTGQAISFNPPLMSILLGWLDRLGNAPVAFVLCMQVLFSASIWLIFRRHLQAHPAQIIIAMFVLSSPVIALYTGIVWKDVLLAHCVLFLFFYLNHLHHSDKQLNLMRISLCLVLMTIIVGSRQQGILFLIPTAISLSLLYPAKKPFKSVLFILFIAIPMVLNNVISTSLAENKAGKDGTTIGLMLLMKYDLIGTLAKGGELPSKTDSALASELEGNKVSYSPYRVDTFAQPTPRYWSLSLSQAASLWKSNISNNSFDYLSHRADHFAKLLGLGNSRQCLPLHSGVTDFYHPEVKINLTEALGFQAGPHSYSNTPLKFGYNWANSPLFNHAFYALICFVLMIRLIKQKDYILASLGFTSLAMLFSYSVISIACDFRYAYVLAISTTGLLAYVIVSARARHEQ